jgi:hypothetical protein
VREHRREAVTGGPPHVTAIVRDVVEIVAILAAGLWAFYVFAYENRIKPSLADPDVNVKASMVRLGDHNGLMAIGLHVELRNVGTVKAHFLGVAVNVYGQRVVAATPLPVNTQPGNSYTLRAYYRSLPRVPVFAYAYVTRLGDPKTTQDTELDAGSTIENDHTFYVPHGVFDLLTVAIDAPYTKYNRIVPTMLRATPQGGVQVVTQISPQIEQYTISPVTSLDIR